jgi:hypothetical protein
MLIKSKHGILVIFRNGLNGIWDFYHGTNRGAGSPKSFQLQGSGVPCQFRFGILGRLAVGGRSGRDGGWLTGRVKTGGHSSLVFVCVCVSKSARAAADLLPSLASSRSAAVLCVRRARSLLRWVCFPPLHLLLAYFIILPLMQKWCRSAARKSNLWNVLLSSFCAEILRPRSELFVSLVLLRVVLCCLVNLIRSALSSPTHCRSSWLRLE